MKLFNTSLLVSSSLGIAFLSGCQKPEDLGGCQFPEFEKLSLVWSDEFDGTEVDSTKWSYDLGNGCQLDSNLCGWGNNELQYYTSRPENVFVNGGILTIKAIKENPLYLGQYQYTSTRMVTKNKGTGNTDAWILEQKFLWARAFGRRFGCFLLTMCTVFGQRVEK